MQSIIATTDDTVAITRLVNAAYRGAGGQLGWTHEGELMAGERTKPDDVADLIRSPSITVLIRRDAKRVLVGCIAIEIVGVDRCTISMLAVSPELQDSGLGRNLLADAEQFAIDKGLAVADMTVVEQRESLISWYGRRGYQWNGKHKDFPYDANVGKPLRDDLRFVVLEKRLTPA